MQRREPGRALDALVAEKVMGWEWQAHPTEDLRYFRPADRFQYGAIGRKSSDLVEYTNQLSAYSTDIAAAWQIVERLHEKGLCVGVSTLHAWETKCECSIYFAETMGEMVANANADTAPHAICLAALEALEAHDATP